MSQVTGKSAADSVTLQQPIEQVYERALVVELTADDESTTTAQVSSRASVGTTMVDYGKNHDNVERVKAWLSEGSPAA